MTRPALLLPPRGALAALALSLLCAAGAAAQTPAPAAASTADSAAARVVFAGRVFDAATRRPVAGARVEFPTSALRAVSDSTGVFRIEPVAAGNHDLAIAALGFRPIRVVVALREEMPSVEIPLALQAADSTALTEFAGRVVDAETGRALAEARVEFVGEGRPVLTDGEGRFRIVRAEAGAHMLRVRATGYPTLASLVEVVPGMEPSTIRLQQDVMMLEALRVTADRFDRRRRSTGMPGRVLRSGELASSRAPDMLVYLRDNLGVSESVCGALGNGKSSGCIRVRGLPVVPQIYLDDAPYIGSLATLDMYEPRDFARLEVYSGGSIMMLYTVEYMERLARSGNRPIPFLLRY